MSGSPRPSELIAVLELLGADSELAEAARRRRDRELGRTLDRLSAQPARQVLAWARARLAHPDAAAIASRAARAQTALTLASGGCVAAGSLLGALTALGAFFYDGGGRVNVLVLLALFVAIPLLTLLTFALAACGVTGSAFHPGRIGAAIARLAGPAHGDAPRLLQATGGGAVTRWLLLAWSQWLGFGYAAGATAAAAALVVFTDLAFGWSTTLDLAPRTLHTGLVSLAAPWRDWLPGAVPDLALVEASRFFRLEGARGASDPALLGRWWPFVLMAMVCYALAPRALTLVLCRWRLRVACREALLASPSVHRLVDRMNTPLVETAAEQPEAAGRCGPARPALEFELLPRAPAWRLVNWSEVPVRADTLASALQPAPLLEEAAAGGGRSYADDQRLADELATSEPPAGVLVVARSWEPPTLDLLDLLATLRERLPSALPVVLAPLRVAADGHAQAPSRDEQGPWQRTLAQRGPAGVILASLAPAGKE